jgi:hypothetical protein
VFGVYGTLPAERENILLDMSFCTLQQQFFSFTLFSPSGSPAL